jgi:hypothetical protein
MSGRSLCGEHRLSGVIGL